MDKNKNGACSLGVYKICVSKHSKETQNGNNYP